MTLPHPKPHEISLPDVLTALGDETRLAIIGCLSKVDPIEGLVCGQFCTLTSKTNLTYHVGKLREAGVIQVTPEGTKRRVTLRRADLDNRFPGFLDSILASAVVLPAVEATLQDIEAQDASAKTA